MMHLLRRPLFSRILRLVVAALTVLVAAGVAAAAAALVWWLRAEVSTVGEVTFDRQVAIPPLADSRVDVLGRRVFDLFLQPGSTEFRPGVATDTWGVNSSYLGPTLRASRGERVLLNVRNQLDEPTTIHWHGMHLPARMDGGPHQLIRPGTTWSPTWGIDQRAATLWYHPHLHRRTATHLYRGIAGMFILDDPQVTSLHLPHRYGVDDVPVIVQDKKFGDDGRLDEDSALVSPTGLLGDTILVNGTVGPYLQVMTERVRLRLLNASNARIYNFGLSDDRPFTMIASDGGLLARPHQTRRLLLSPGERAEILVTVRPAERTVLRSYPADLGSDFWNQRFAGGDDTLDILQLRATSSLAPSKPVPTTLSEVPRQSAEPINRRDFRLGGTSINGRDMDIDRIDVTVTAGTTEVWRLSSPGATPHNFHIHGIQFQVLDVSGRPPPPPLGGWKDTVYVRPDSSMTLVMRFTDYTDSHAPYMFHCHLLSHEDRGMMGQLVVVKAASGPEPHLATTTTGS